jgi:mRNA interferase MazF
MYRGEVWLLNLDPTIGSEIKKTRPVVIISSDALGILPLRVIVPVSEWKDRYSHSAWIVQVTPMASNGLSKPSCVDCFQCRSVDTQRFIHKMGSLQPDEVDRIARAVGTVIEIPIP